MTDEIILVDIFDNEIGSGSKEEVHKLGKLHRAFSVFIIDKDKMLIQKRSRNKYHSGGLWTNSCCSHPRKGESLEVAVNRRLYEEIGLKSELKEIGSFIYHTKFSENLYEYEYDHIFVGNYYGDNVIENKDEVECTKWINIKELQKDVVENPENYTVWFITALPIVLNSLTKK